MSHVAKAKGVSKRVACSVLSNAMENTRNRGLKSGRWAFRIKQPCMTEKCSDVVGTKATDELAEINDFKVFVKEFTAQSGIIEGFLPLSLGEEKPEHE